jgi:heterodisulfide reductase subunit A
VDYEQEDKIVEVEIGNIIVTTGYDLLDPTSIKKYGYGRYPEVYTGLEFERICNSMGPTGGEILNKEGKVPKTIAIVHCVGSRDENYHEYCSRVCCMYALKYSHLIKEKIGARVYQMYIDMRCVSKGYEEFYNRLSKEGVNFIRGKVGEVTDVAVSEEEKGKLIVICEDTLIRSMIRVPVDMVILCTAIEPRSDASNVSQLLSINCGNEGFFTEKHPKLDPVATMTDGIFVAGCCQGPKDIPDTVAQASAAAARVLGLISQGKTQLEASTAFIDEEKCSGCRICNALCPYSAISFDEEKSVSVINEALCKGCGVCVAACPSAAITHRHFTTEEITAEIGGLLV